MKPIVELITEWDAFSGRHPDATVSEFCNFYLSKKKTAAAKELFAGMMPPDADTALAKLIDRISAIHIAYAKTALKETEGIELEWFYFLNAIYHQQEARKTDVINFHFFEQSTGVDILNRIKKAGYITEREDPHDKRAKLVKLTAKGEKLILRLYGLLYKPAFLLYNDITTEEKQLIVKLLSKTEVKHSQLLIRNRNKPIDELIRSTIEEEKVKAAQEKLTAQVAAFRHKRK